ncbi:MAG: DUF3348 family protein [Pseudomonadota bacterium]|nr:DUF3348 family protein [Pseudomonadota bacterium]
MTPSLTPSPHRQVRLVRLLTELALIEDDWPQREFADRLGQMFNFADSIILADAHKMKPERGFMAVTDSADELKQAVSHAKGKLVQGIIESCSLGTERPKIRWPALAEDDPELKYERFHRFYLSHQREQDLALRALRSSGREALTGCSPALKKLALLDRVLEDTLWDHTARFLAAVPRLLERRFDRLRAGEGEARAEPGWLVQFRKDVQSLLLAELDLRLQPVLGLVESLERCTSAQRLRAEAPETGYTN